MIWSCEVRGKAAGAEWAVFGECDGSRSASGAEEKRLGTFFGDVVDDGVDVSCVGLGCRDESGSVLHAEM